LSPLADEYEQRLTVSVKKDLQLPLSVDERALVGHHGRDRLIQTKRTDCLGRRHATRDDATIDALQALNIRHVKLTGYDKAKTNWQTVSVSRHADSQLRGSASPVELTTHVKTLETHRESVLSPGDDATQSKRRRSRTGCRRHRRRRLWLREWILGGVTRDLLLRDDRCALLSH
jgi:hypothetical protein